MLPPTSMEESAPSHNPAVFRYKAPMLPERYLQGEVPVWPARPLSEASLTAQLSSNSSSTNRKLLSSASRLVSLPA